MPVTDLSPKFFTLAQMAEQVAVSEMTLRREIKRGELRPSRIGRCLRVTPEEIERWRLSKAVESEVAS